MGDKVTQFITSISAEKYTPTEIRNANIFVVTPNEPKFIPYNKVPINNLDDRLREHGFIAVRPVDKWLFERLFKRYLEYGARISDNDSEAWEKGRRKQMKGAEKQWVFWILAHPTSAFVTRAMLNSKNGAKPANLGTDIKWHVVDPKTNTPHPLKKIWALATTGSCNDFINSATLRGKLQKLGFYCIQLSNPNDETELQKNVVTSLSSSREERQERLKAASAYPERIVRTVVVFRRNPDVIAESLEIANGHCGICKRPAPFRRSKDDTAYLEVHHKTPLSQDGQDTVDNTIAICPNCHREAHDVMASPKG